MKRRKWKENGREGEGGGKGRAQDCGKTMGKEQYGREIGGWGRKLIGRKECQSRKGHRGKAREVSDRVATPKPLTPAAVLRRSDYYAWDIATHAHIFKRKKEGGGRAGARNFLNHLRHVVVSFSLLS